ncbi:sacsin-like [Liolophura sinensis]|uniref:sacsin-like n=1 Tax=Liolophura sinensis TaxID=3198878 RepID=UPI003158AD72
MDNSDSEGEVCGIERPSLVEDLRTVLEEYPDNGQIFKELIQNAEDAGATKVKIIYDATGPSVDVTGNSSPHFQGPAIYVYNDAKFTDADWKGIKMLRKSVKKDDPMKIGRYGLGFKSVFHITDFPSVVSGDTLLLLDPSKPEGKSCTLHLLSKNKRTVQCMWRSFERVLSSTIFDTNTKDGFDGTVFRFPLRKSPSELSRGLYDDEKICHLLESFRTEMMLILVFLRSLDSVEIWRSKVACGDSPELSFSACLMEKSAKERRDRKTGLEEDVFFAKTGYRRTSTVSYQVTDHLTTLSFSLSWTVASLCLGGKEIPLSLDPIMESPPFVGVAIVAVPKTSREVIMRMGLMEKALQGHVYCFLPLPLVNTNNTGLPVQINGFFALSANRHHLKWPTADEEQHCCDTRGDGSSRWNKDLLTRAIPRAYCDLITKLIETSKAESNTEESVRAVYEAFPSVTSVNGIWTIVLKEFWKLVLQTACFFSERNSGRWVTVSEAAFCKDQTPSNIPVEVQDSLRRLGTTVCCIPARVIDTVQSLADGRMKLVTPELVRELLKKTSAYKREPRSVKLHLLDFIMEDIPAEQNFSQLHGIELLPLSDEKFAAFQNEVSIVLLRYSFWLGNPSHTGRTQLRPVKRGDMPKLLEQVSWKTKTLSGKDIVRWVTNVWSMLCSEFPCNLSLFEGLTLLPVSTVLDQLKRPSLKVLKEWNGVVLSDEVEAVLVSMGVQVIRNAVGEMLNHPGVVGVFILEPTSSSVLKALTTARANNLGKRTPALTEKLRSAFVSFLSTCRRDLTQAEHSMLISLPLFKTVDQSKEVSHVSVQDLNTSVPEEYEQIKDVFPVTFPRRLIVYNNSDESRLGSMLRVQQLSHRELVLKVIETMLSQHSAYTDDEVCRFMKYVIKNFTDSDQSVWKLAKDIPFVPCSDHKGTLRRPVDLIHPADQIARLYNSSEGRFPSQNCEAFHDKQTLATLEKLGMLKNCLPSKEILGRARFIAKLSKSHSEEAVEKFVLLMHVLRRMETVDDLKLTADDTNDLAETHFLPVLQRPEQWPSSLEWKADSELPFQRPRYVCDGRHRDLVGSRCLILVSDGLEEFSETVLKKLGVSVELKPVDVVDHLFCLKRIETSVLRPDEMTCLKQMYERLYSYLEDHIRESDVTHHWMEKLRQLDCVFVDTRHISPQSVACECDIDCSPYLFKLSDGYSRRYPNTMSLFGIKKHFSSSDLLHYLQKFYEDHREKRLDARSMRLLHNMITLLLDSVNGEHGQVNETGSMMLPDQTGTLRPTEMLCFDDSSWIEELAELNYVHDSVSVETAKRLGVKGKQNWCLYQNADGIEELFGQKEELTSRLNGILQAYPCDFTLLTELLQNADDAGATEIQFIKDWRFHKSDKAFSEAWKELHGPALCVYNNADFTDEDLKGIQRLGKGSKTNDPLKTGKFGVGFNVVYHLTDAPSFLIKSPTKQTLCALDPSGSYLPNLRPGQSGKRWTDLDVLGERFPDSVACYPESVLNQNQVGTLFRLPLRNGKSAQQSLIKPEEMTVEELEKLLEVFQNGAKEALLFTESVNTIKIINVNGNGELETQYEVKAQLSLESFLKKQMYLSKRKELIQSEKSLENIDITKVQYIVDLNDHTGRESWFVKQQIGFENPKETPDVVKKAYSQKKVNLLPTGGVAFPLTQPEGRVCKAFRGLPLPIPTGLPVQLEADFVLDYEHRSSLYHSPVSDVNTEWNKTVIGHLLAPLYASGLLDMREMLFSKTPSTANSVAVQTYHALFPSIKKASDDYWKQVCQAFYQSLSHCASRVLLITDENQSPEGKLVSVQKWLPVNGKESEHGFFNTLSRQFPHHENNKLAKVARLTALLKKLHFNITETPLDVYENFYEAKVNVKEVHPDAVVSFLHTASDSSHCKVGNVPCPLRTSLINNENNLHELLSYCHRSRQLKHSLEGLPLLLTYDGNLRVFRESQKVFESKHHDILPHSQSCFLNWNVEKILSSNFDYPIVRYGQVRPLQIADYARCLPIELPQTVFGCNQPVEFINKTWLKSVWEFLTEQVAKVEKKKSPHKLTADQILEHLQDILMWSLIPVTTTYRGVNSSYLLPISFAEQIFTSNGWVIEDHLREMGVYFYVPFDENKELPSRLLVSCSDPGKVLIGLTKALESSRDTVHVTSLTNDQCEDILGYFSKKKQIDQLSKIPGNKVMLKRLPFYVTVNNHAVKVEDARAIVLPDSIPSVGMLTWSKKESLVLLKENKSLAHLYKYLELHIYQDVDFYSRYLFPLFELLDEEARIVHLEFVRDRLVPITKRDPKSKFRQALQKLPFIPRNMKLEKASSFYDREHHLFKVMLSEGYFVPETFWCEEWRDMLIMAGLTNTVTCDKFVGLAKQLEANGRCSGNLTKIAGQSQHLIENLYKEQECDERLLERIRDIKFLVSCPIAEELQAFVSLKRYEPMICFNGSILPEYQDLVFTTSDVLSYSFDKICTNLKILGIKSSPTPQDVVQNLQNILKRMEQLQQDGLEFVTDKLFKIVRETFKFLQSENLSEDLRERLRHSPCVVIQDHQCFVKPQQVVVELKSQKQIVPYLFALPKTLGPFLELLQSIGVSESPSPQHYEKVLAQIRESYQDGDLKPGEAEAARMATRGLYEGLITKNDYVPTDLLYLPAQKGDSTVIWNSSEVVISDNPVLKTKARDVLDFVYLVDFNDQDADEPNFDKMKFWERLPDSHKPQLLSNLVEEKLTHSCESLYRQSETRCQALKAMVSSPEVQRGVVKLINHFAPNDSNIESRSIIDKIQRLISSVRIFCLPQVITCLVHQGNIVPGTESYSLSRHCEVVETGDMDELHIILKEGILEDASKSLHEICLSLCSKMPNVPNEVILHIHQLLSLAHGRQPISDYLNEQRICEDWTDEQLGGASAMSSPGNYIPVSLHGSLDQSFLTLTPGQCVAYECSDPVLSGEDGDAVYRYATVLEEVGKRADSWKKDYKIDIGDTLTVPTTDLYAFHTRSPVCSEEAAISIGSTTSAGADRKQESKSLQEVETEIYQILKEAWEINKTVRNKVLKRLLLKWYPDANSELKDFRTKVTEYIHDLVKQFESKEKVFDDDVDNRVDKDDTNTHDDILNPQAGVSGRCDMYESISARGRAYWKEHGELTRADELWLHPNPQPSEGRRWLRQAQADFKAVGNDENGHPPSPAWACFKCLQAAEKALKAALLAKNANDSARSSHYLEEIAGRLDNKTLYRLARDLEDTLGRKGHLATRYPDMLRAGEIPSEFYKMDKVIQTKQLCREMLAVIEPILQTSNV